jgi:hypothetical protein
MDGTRWQATGTFAGAALESAPRVMPSIAPRAIRPGTSSGAHLAAALARIMAMQRI